MPVTHYLIVDHLRLPRATKPCIKLLKGRRQKAFLVFKQRVNPEKLFDTGEDILGDTVD